MTENLCFHLYLLGEFYSCTAWQASGTTSGHTTGLESAKEMRSESDGWMDFLLKICHGGLGPFGLGSVAQQKTVGTKHSPNLAVANFLV